MCELMKMIWERDNCRRRDLSKWFRKGLSLLDLILASQRSDTDEVKLSESEQKLKVAW